MIFLRAIRAILMIVVGVIPLLLSIRLNDYFFLILYFWWWMPTLGVSLIFKKLK